MAAEKILSTAKESSSESESVYISHLVARLAASGSQTVLRYRNENITERWLG
jgi:hypothetical protein